MDIKEAAKSKYNGRFPQQQLPMSKKNRVWRAAHLEWADSKTFFNYGPVRNSSIHNILILNAKLIKKLKVCKKKSKILIDAYLLY